MCTPWVAAEETAEGEPCSFQSTVNLDRIYTVVAATRIMPTYSMSTARQTQPWGNGELVEADQFCEHPGHAAASTFRSYNSTFKEGVLDEFN
jgi:hypothetical protein